MRNLRTLVIAGMVLGSTVMCSSKERQFRDRDPAEDGAGQGGEAGASAGEGGSDGGEANLGGAGGQAGESSAGESSAGENSAGESSTGGVSTGGTSNGGTSTGGTSGAAGVAGVASGGGAAGTGSGCPSASSRCIQAAPTGWRGPMLVTANAVSSCPSGFPTKSATLFSGLAAGSASCACNCGAPQVSCAGTASTTFYQGTGTGCSISVAGQPTTEGVCRQESNPIAITFTSQPTANCNAAVVQPSFPLPSWSQSLNACSGAQPQGTCSASGEVCVASPSAPFAAKYCIARPGDESCPSAYPVRSPLFAGYADTRACPSACSCTAAGQECALQVDVYPQADCSGSYTRKTVASGSQVCAISDPTVQRAYYATRVVSKPGTCSATTNALTVTGRVTESDLTTLCCTE
jgi:hypothetical protein